MSGEEKRGEGQQRVFLHAPKIVLGSLPKAQIERSAGTLNCAKDHSEEKYLGSIF